MANGGTPLGSAGPSLNTEPAYSTPYNIGQADYPENDWTRAARAAMWTPAHAQFDKAYEYGAGYPQYVTWDYASAFLYARPELTPYPYVLIPS